MQSPARLTKRLILPRRKQVRSAGLLLAAVIAVCAALLPPRTAQAINIKFPVQPPQAVIGTSITFSSVITLATAEYAPIQAVNLYIFKSNARATTQATSLNLPLSTLTKDYQDAETGGGRIIVYASADSKFVLNHAEGYGPGPAAIRYDIVWEVPSRFLPGTYQAELKMVLTGASTSQFSDAFSVIIQPQGTTILAGYVNGASVFVADIQLTSADSWATVDIARGTKGLVRRENLSEISIIQFGVPPGPPPPNTVPIGRLYNFGPEGTTFDRPVTIGLRYEQSDLPAGAGENNTVMASWNATASDWDVLPSQVNASKDTVSGTTAGFGVFALFVPNRPASFSVGELVINPASVDAGKQAVISVTANNTGDLSGTFPIILKLDNLMVASQDVTVAGRSSQKILFPVTRANPGSYTIEVNGITGTLTVRALPTAPPKPTTTSKPSTAPAVTITPTQTPAPTASPKPSPSPSPTGKPPAPPIPLAPPPGIDWWPALRILVPVLALFGFGIWLVVTSFRR